MTETENGCTRIWEVLEDYKCVGFQMKINDIKFLWGNKEIEERYVDR